MASSKPIGIFDSGVGGLSVLGHIQQLLPAEDLLYVADSGHLPYGNKSPDYVQERSLFICDFLIRQGAKSIVVACNTATAAAISTLREHYTLPIIGMEPGLKPGIEQSCNGKVAILATEGTLGSGKFQSLLDRHGNDAEVLIQPCHGWVELVENQHADANKTHQAVYEQITHLLSSGVDTLVLGCTHYPFLKRPIAQIAGDNIRIIDTGMAVAKQLRRRLAAAGLLADSTQPGTEQFWSSVPGDHTDRLISRLWGRPVKVQPLPDMELQKQHPG